MKSIRIDLPRDLERIHIYTFADWHIGDKFCRINDIQSLIDKVKNDEQGYVICNGDLINNATKNSVSDGYSETLSPMESINYLVSLLTPIKDRILLITNGNHEARSYRESGIDLSSIVAAQLGILDRYCCEGGLLFLKVGKESKGRRDRHGEVRQIPYTIYATHGAGGGAKEGGKINRTAGLADIVDADIYIHSHTHLPAIFKNAYFRVDQANCMVNQTDRLFVNTSSQLDYGGYGQVASFKPSSTSVPVITLDGTKKIFSAKL